MPDYDKRGGGAGSTTDVKWYDTLHLRAIRMCGGVWFVLLYFYNKHQCGSARRAQRGAFI